MKCVLGSTFLVSLVLQSQLLAQNNDDFANRIDLGEALTASAHASNVLATVEPGEFPHSPGRVQWNELYASIWWQWQAPRDGWVVFDLRDSTIPPVFNVYTGDHLTELQQVAHQFTWTSHRADRFFLRAKAGEVYQIAADSPSELNRGEISFNLKYVKSVGGNDSFATRHDLGSGDEIEVVLDHDPSSVGWWQWTPSADRIVRLRNRPESSSSFQVVTGNSESSLTPIDNQGANFLAKAGTTYTITSAAKVVTLEAYPIPSNDAFIDATDLGSQETVSVLSPSYLATIEPGEDRLNESFHIRLRSRWWKWTAPEAGLYVMDTTGRDYGQWIEPFRGDTLDDLATARLTNHLQWPYFEAEEGETLYIRASCTDDSLASVYEFNLSRVNGPTAKTNDQLANAINLGDRLPAIAEGNNAGATIEKDEALSRGSQSVWWNWTAPHNGFFKIDATGTRLQEVVEVYEAGVFPLTEVAFGHNFHRGARQESFPDGERTGTYFAGKAGQTYAIAIRGQENSTTAGRIRFRIDEIIQSGNNTPETATAIGSPTHYVLHTHLTEPAAPEMLDGSRLSYVGYWNWTAPESGTLHLSHSREGYDLDLSLTHPAIGPLRVPQYSSRAAAQVQRGTTYQIRLATKEAIGSGLSPGSSAHDPVILRLDLRTDLANDRFEDAFDLGDGLTTKANGSTIGATAEPSEPSHRGTLAEQSVWWRWTAPESRWMLFSSSASEAAAIYSGQRLGELQPVRLLSFASSASMLEVTKGESYSIAFDSVGIPFNFSLLAAPTPPVNDLYENRTSLGSELPLTIAVPVGSSIETREEGEPTSPRSGSSGSLWWSWTAPVTSEITFSALSELRLPDGSVNTTPPPLITVHEEADVVNELSPSLADTMWQFANGLYDVSVKVEAGTTYAISLSNLGSGTQSLFGIHPTESQPESLVPPDSYDDWIAQFEDLPADQRGKNDSPAGDGMTNLLKLALGLDPREFVDPANSPLRIQQDSNNVNVSYPSSPFLEDDNSRYAHYLESSADGILWERELINRMILTERQVYRRLPGARTDLFLQDGYYRHEIERSPEEPTRLYRLRIEEMRE